jgi:excisionase family DNA binding protein
VENPEANSPSIEEMFDIFDLARILHAGTSTVRKWIAEGKIPHVRVGRRILVKASDLKALINGRAVA